MKRRLLWCLALAGVFGAVGMFSQSGGNAQTAPSPDRIGKFQIAISQAGPNIGNLVICDTETGQAWYALSRTGEGWADWRAIKPPAAERR